MDNLTQARANLSAFVISEAQHLCNVLGFSILPCENAPDTFEKLQAEYTQAKITGNFRVYNQACDNTIYTSSQANIAFRFWHDLIHVKQGLDFSHDSEVLAGNMQAARIAQVFGLGSLEYTLMLLDTIGQADYFKQTGQFIENQLDWVISKLQ